MNNFSCLLDAAKLNQNVKVDANSLVALFLKAKDIAHKSTQIGGDQAARLDILINDVVDSIPQMFRVMSAPPEYHIGRGPDLEFVVTAKTLSKDRAEQIVSLLNKMPERNKMSLYVLTQEQVADMVKKAIEQAPPVQVLEVLHALASDWECGQGKSNLKLEDTALYPMNYKTDEKVYHLGRCDGLE